MLKRGYGIDLPLLFIKVAYPEMNYPAETVIHHVISFFGGPKTSIRSSFGPAG